ncbi:MAG: ABC transporter permease [bacterium]
MHLYESIKSAISCLLTNKGRLTLGIVSISIGVATLMGAVVISESRKVFLKREFEKIGSNLMTIWSEPKPGLFTLKDVEMIKRYEGVYRIAPYIGGINFPITYFNKSMEAFIYGTTPENKDMNNFTLKYGRFFTHQEVISRCNVGVIRNRLASNLFGKRNPVGETIFIIKGEKRFPMRVVGILNEVGIYQGGLGENEGIILPLTFMDENLISERRRGKLRHIKIQARDKTALKRLCKQTKSAFEIERNYSCSIYTYDEFIDAEYKILKRNTLIGISLSIIFFIVGGIGIMNIMLKSVLERTREIGIRKAVGAKNRDVLIQFLIEAFIIGMLGCFVGILIGIGGSYFISNWLIKTTTVIISLQTIVISCGVALILTLLFGLYPALRASSLSPIDALRYE